MKKIIKSLLIVIVGILATSQVALAHDAILSTSPALSTSTVNSAFDVSVQVNPTNNQVCVVKGTIALNNLTCQNITVASGIMAQTMPTCSAPSFTLGIPKCTTSPQNLFSVSVKGSQVGQASTSLSGVKVIGAGTDVAFVLENSNYNIVAVVDTPGSKPKNALPITPKVISIIGSSTTKANQGNNQVNMEASTTATTSTTTESEKSFISGLTASVIDALVAAYNFIVRNIISVLTLLVVILIISNILLWIKYLKAKENKEE